MFPHAPSRSELRTVNCLSHWWNRVDYGNARRRCEVECTFRNRYIGLFATEGEACRSSVALFDLDGGDGACRGCDRERDAAYSILLPLRLSDQRVLPVPGGSGCKMKAGKLLFKLGVAEEKTQR